MVDGARMATPGLLLLRSSGACLYENSVVACLGWHLGHDFQRSTIQSGYDQSQKTPCLTRSIGRTTAIAFLRLAPWTNPQSTAGSRRSLESNALFMHRAAWKRLGGLDERFNAPGDGLVSLDLFRRAAELPDCELVILLGGDLSSTPWCELPPVRHLETFHNKFSEWAEQYQGRSARHRPYGKSRALEIHLPPHWYAPHPGPASLLARGA